MKVACIGAMHLDIKARVTGEVHPGTSNPARTVRTPGGAAGNIARNLGRLGLPVTLFSIVGDDAAGHSLLGELHAASVDTSGVQHSPGPPTASYLAILDREGRLVVGAADMEVYDLLDLAWADRVGPTLGKFDAWVVDANLPAATIARLLPYAARGAGARRSGVGRQGHPPRHHPAAPRRGFPRSGRGPHPGGAASRGAGIGGRRRRRHSAARARRVVVSLGWRGAYVDDGALPRQVPALPARSVVDVTGAGDAQIAGYVYGLSRVGSGHAAIDWGMAAASLTVETIDSARADLTPALLTDRLAGRR